MISQDLSSIQAVQLRVPDTNTPANPKTQQQQQQQQQQQRSSSSNPLNSEYSLFELETFFNRWAPDSDFVSARGGPSCPFTNDDSSAECDQDGVMIVETEPQPQHVLQPPQGSVSSAARKSGGQVQPSASQGNDHLLFLEEA